MDALPFIMLITAALASIVVAKVALALPAAVRALIGKGMQP